MPIAPNPLLCLLHRRKRKLRPPRSMRSLWSRLARSPRRTKRGTSHSCAAILSYRGARPPWQVCATHCHHVLLSYQVSQHCNLGMSAPPLPSRTRAQGVRQVRALFHAALSSSSSRPGWRRHCKHVRLLIRLERGKHGSRSQASAACSPPATISCSKTVGKHGPKC